MSEAAPASSTFCPMPWLNLSTETDGKCKICCVVMYERYVSKPDGQAYSLQRERIEDIWNSEYLKDVRRKMLAGEKVADCTYCYASEASGTSSPRLDYAKRWSGIDLDRRVHLSRAADGQVDSLPVSLEPRPGNACNLRCVSCWSMSSSRVHLERRKLLQDEGVPLPGFLRDTFSREVELADASDFGWSSEPVYLENFRKCVPGLRRLYFTGGEPMLIRSNFEALEELVRAGRTDPLVSFTTNLTRIDSKWIELLSKFKSVEITGSIDGVGVENDYIRYPSQWKTVSENLLKLYALPNRVWLSIMSVVQFTNIFSILELIRWAERHATADRPLQVIPTFLQSPSYLRLDILPASLRREAMREIDGMLEDPAMSRPNRGHLRAIRLKLEEEHPDAALLRGQFKDYVGVLDRARGTSYAAAFPRFVPVLDA